MAIVTSPASGQPVTLTDAQQQTLLELPNDNHPHTRNLGDHRLLARSVQAPTRAG